MYLKPHTLHYRLAMKCCKLYYDAVCVYMHSTFLIQLRNRLNTVQNTKVQSQKEALAKKRQVLTDKREELKALTRGLEEVQSSHVTSAQLGGLGRGIIGRFLGSVHFVIAS